MLSLKEIKRLDDEIEKRKKKLELLSSIVGMEAKCEEITQEIQKLEAQKQAGKIDLAEQIIDRIPNALEANVLIFRYVKGEKFSVIADEMQYSQSNIYKLHRAGLKQFEEAETSEIARIGKISDSGG